MKYMGESIHYLRNSFHLADDVLPIVYHEDISICQDIIKSLKGKCDKINILMFKKGIVFDVTPYFLKWKAVMIWVVISDGQNFQLLIQYTIKIFLKNL